MKNKFIYIIFFITCLAFITIAQTTFNEFKKNATNHNNDTIRINALNNLAVYYSQSNIKLALVYIDSVLLEIKIAQIHNEKVDVFYIKQKAKAFNTLAHIELQKGNVKKAIEYCLQAINVFEKLKDFINMSKLYNTLALNLKSVGYLNDAIFYLKKSLAIDEKIVPKSKQEFNDIDLIGTLINLSGTYFDANQTDSLLHYTNKAFLIIDTSQISENLGLLNYNKACFYSANNDYNNAIKYLKKSLNIFNQLNIPEQLTITNYGLADSYLSIKDYIQSLLYINELEQISKKHGFKQDLLMAYEFKANLYNILKDDKNELLYLKEGAILKDSLAIINHTEQIEELKTKYETEKKEAEIVKLSTENKIQELQIQADAATKSRLYIIIASVLIGLFLVSAFLFYINKLLKQQRHSNVLLQQKNTEIQQQTEKILKQEVELSKYQSQMNPHFISNALNGIQGLILNDDNGKAFEQTQLLSKVLRTTLNNSDQDLITLKEELEYNQQYISFEFNRTLYQIKYTVNTIGLENSEEEILIAPMILQPILENSIKHADLNNTTNAYITVEIIEFVNEKLLQIIISDNGKGIDFSKLEQSNSKALRITKNRITQLMDKYELKKDNCFTITNNEPTGAKTIIFLPLLYK